jgi:hypothetical protein
LTNDELNAFFDLHEWYDNSRIKMIRGCKRKAFFQLIGPRGTRLEGKVGDGANFGSSIHAGLARYYNGWGKFDEPSRRVHACRAFAEEWENYFPHDRMQNKHRLDRGLTILDAYFDHYLSEDAAYEPVEAELGFCIEIAPNKQETESIDTEPVSFGGELHWPSEPFWYIGRVDGIFKRLSTGEVYLRETKTTSSQAEARLRQLKFDHQPVGYTYCVRNLSGDLRHNIVGYIGDVILVAATKLEFARDYFHVSERQAQNWRQQVIYTVEDWRALCAQAYLTGGTGEDDPPIHNLNRFYQDTERCFEYGKCAFYELCDYGISDDTLDQFNGASWNPLLKRTPANVELATEAEQQEVKSLRRI